MLLDQRHDIRKVDPQCLGGREGGNPILIPASPCVDGVDELLVLIFAIAPQRQPLLLGRHPCQIDTYQVAADQFGPVLAEMRKIAEVDLTSIEEQLEAAGAPWTPGRIPEWSPE